MHLLGWQNTDVRGHSTPAMFISMKRKIKYVSKLWAIRKCIKLQINGSHYKYQLVGRLSIEDNHRMCGESVMVIWLKVFNLFERMSRDFQVNSLKSWNGGKMLISSIWSLSTCTSHQICVTLIKPILMSKTEPQKKKKMNRNSQPQTFNQIRRLNIECNISYS